MSVLLRVGPPFPQRLRTELEDNPEIQDNAPIDFEKLQLDANDACMFCSEPFAPSDTFEWHRWGTLDGQRRHCFHVGHHVCPTMPNSGLAFVSRCPECNVVWDRPALERPPAETVQEMRDRLARERYNQMVQDVALLLSTDPLLDQRRRQLRHQLEITAEGDALAQGVPWEEQGGNTDAMYAMAAQKRRDYNNYAHAEGLALPFPNEPDPVRRNLAHDFEEDETVEETLERLYTGCITCIDCTDLTDEQSHPAAFEAVLTEREVLMEAHGIDHANIFLWQDLALIDKIVHENYILTTRGYLTINVLLRHLPHEVLITARLADAFVLRVPLEYDFDKYKVAYDILKLMFTYGIWTNLFLSLALMPEHYEELCLLLRPRGQRRWVPGARAKWCSLIAKLPHDFKVTMRGFLMITYGIDPLRLDWRDIIPETW